MALSAVMLAALSSAPLLLAQRGGGGGRIGRGAPPQTPAAPAANPQMGAQPNAVRGDEINDAQREAVRKGLERLAAHQNKDGTFGNGNDGVGATSAVTALAGLAFMEDGNLPGRGKYGDNVKKCVDAMLSRSQESGLLVAEQVHPIMYSHGFATLFLAEVYGMTGDENVKEKLQKAVRLIQKTQNPQGGWRYQPVPADADISVTICQVMALRAARDAGIKVEKEVIDKAIEYVRGCQNPDGGFSYMTGGFGGGQTGSAFPRSAAGVAALYYAGVFEGDDIKRGLAYIRQYKPGVNAGGMGSQHYFYGQYYAVQAMFLAGGDYWAEWYPAIRNDLIAKQTPDGGWTGEVTDDYCTAVALIILQVPNRYLPVFSGKGPGS
jgi:hypothetical protein